MAGDDEGKDGTEGKHGGRNQWEVGDLDGLEIMAVLLIYHSLPLRNRLNDGCTDVGMEDALKHLKTEWKVWIH